MEVAAQSRYLALAIDAVLEKMDEREAGVIRLRFGLGRENAHSVEEIAKRWGIPRDTVRRNERNALRKLRRPLRRNLLRRDYETEAHITTDATQSYHYVRTQRRIGKSVAKIVVPSAILPPAAHRTTP